MKKFLFSICFFLFSALLVFSPILAKECSAENEGISDNYIMISQGVLSSGKVVREFDFSLNSPMLEKEGMNKLEIEKCKDKLLENVERFREEFIINFTLIFKDVENKKSNFALGKDLVVTKTQYNSELDSISFAIHYNTQEVWQFYSQTKSNNEETKDDSSKIEFITKQEVSSIFPFAQEINSLDGKTTLAQRYKKAYLSAFEDSSVYVKVANEYKPDFVYNYATPYSNIKSDADIKFVDAQNLYHHVWKAKEENISTKMINLSIKEANRQWWYLTALCVTIVGTDVAVLIAYLVKKKKLWQK